MNPNVETLWAHLEIVGVILVPLFGIWLTNRNENKKREEENQRRHVENQTRLASIEVMIKPMWDWWNRVNGRKE